MSETSSGLYNAPLHTATKLNRDHIEQLISENKVQELLSLYEVQFDALRRAEAQQMLNIQEIRNLKALLGAKSEAENQKLLRSGYSMAAPKAPKASPQPAPKPPKSLEIDIDL